MACEPDPWMKLSCLVRVNLPRPGQKELLMPASRPNVRQHVVPQVYLEKFGGAGGGLQVQEVATGWPFTVAVIRFS